MICHYFKWDVNAEHSRFVEWMRVKDPKPGSAASATQKEYEETSKLI